MIGLQGVLNGLTGGLALERGLNLATLRRQKSYLNLGSSSHHKRIMQLPCSSYVVLTIQR